MNGSKDNGNGARDPEVVRAEAEIARSREAVALSVVALQKELSRKLDWREPIRRQPLLAMALAFGVGAILGGWLPGFSRRGR